MSFRKLKGGVTDKILSPQEEQAKIGEIRKIMGPIVDKFPVLCSDASILRYLRARNWNTKKAAKMLKNTLKWRLEFKPEKILWEDVAQEAATGKLYKADYTDKDGRTVLVMRPYDQNGSSASGQIKYLVYCLENAILNLNPHQEQMIWLIDFQRWTSSSISLKVTRETAHILQDHYPERLGLAILYNPPKVFESFWAMAKPFIEPKTFKKVRFVYPDNPKSCMIMQEVFDLDKLESFFGGRNKAEFNFETYAKKMREDDKKMSDFIDSGCSSPSFLKSVISETHNGSDDESSSDEADGSNLEENGKILQDQEPCSEEGINGELNEHGKVAQLLEN